MIYLFTSIIFTAFLYIIFKAFAKYGVDPLPAIVFNYATRVIFGFIIDPESIPAYIHKSPAPLLLFCTLTGICFILVFSLVSKSTRTIGITATTIVSRMSMVIPAAFSIFYYKESLGWMKLSGILLALIAIYFTVYEKKIKILGEPEMPIKSRSAFWLPVLMFLGSGLADTFMRISQIEYMPNKLDYVFIDIIYSVSALSGIIALIISRTSIKTIFKKQNIIWGVILGADNYIALLLFLLALTKGKMQGSQVFPINSVGIVVFSTIFAVIFFREKIVIHKIIGLAIAIGAILMIGLA